MEDIDSPRIAQCRAASDSVTADSGSGGWTIGVVPIHANALSAVLQLLLLLPLL